MASSMLGVPAALARHSGAAYTGFVIMLIMEQFCNTPHSKQRSNSGVGGWLIKVMEQREPEEIPWIFKDQPYG